MGVIGFTRYMDSVGDGTGTKQAVLDYSSEAGSVMIKAPANGEIRVNRLIVYAQGSGTFAAANYANTGGALTNGITIEVQDASGGVIRELTDGIPIKSNAGWGRQCYDVDRKTWGSGDDILLVRYSFFRTGVPIHLVNGEALVVNFSDDLTDLDEHTFLVQGTEEEQ